MSEQLNLYHEDFNDALRDLVRALGGFKKVGAEIRPELPADQAGRWLANCMDNNRPEKLDPEQVLFLLKKGRTAGIHVAAAYLLREAGYADPLPIEPQDEIAQLQREYINAAKSIKSIADRIERVQIRSVGSL